MNFLNNFSEVNTALIDEPEKEIDKGNTDDMKSMANNIREGEQKIKHHGKELTL